MSGLQLPTNKAGNVKTATELPPYNPDDNTITLLDDLTDADGKVIASKGERYAAPAGSKYVITENGKDVQYILRHPRTVEGGWHKMRPAGSKSDDNGASATTGDAAQSMAQAATSAATGTSKKK